MSTNVVLNNVTYAIPALGDSNWGDNVSNYLIAIASSCLQKSAGTFTLTAELDFGATYGIKSPYFKSRAANPSSTGIVRLGNTEVIAWRNAGNSADLGLTVNASNALQFNGTSLLVSGAIVNADIAALAAIDLSKLAAVTASRVLVSDASGFVSASSTSTTTLGYLDVSSSLTTLLSGKEPTISTLPISKGGTNSGTALSNNRIMQSSAGSIVESSAITAARVLISDANGIPTHSSVTSTTLGYLDATSSIQTQLNGKQASGSYALTTGKLSQFASTTSAELAGVISDETGSGALVFGTSPSLTTPAFSSITNTGTLTLPTSTDTLVGRATSDTLTNKTFGDSIVTTQISKPTSPSSGYNKLYTKTDNKLYVLDSSGNEKSAGGVSVWAASTAYAVNDMVIYSKYTYVAISAHTSGSSMEADLAAGGKWVKLNLEPIAENLAVYGFNFEDNDIGGWTATGCATVTNGLPVSVGSGGAAFSSSNGGRAKGANTTDPAIVSSGAINGQYSLNLATSGAGTIGDGYISGIFPVSIKYQAKVLQLQFSYKVITGSPNMSGTSSNTYACAIYDVVNNAWLGMSGSFNFVQGSGVGTFTGTVQTASNTTGLQVFIYSPVAPTGASALYLDDFYLGPQVTSVGPAMSDWIAYTPTITNLGTGSATATGLWKRVGDSIELQIRIVKDASGGSGSSSVAASLPAGLAIDYTNKITTNTLQVALGTWSAYGIKGSNTNQEGTVWISGNTIVFSNPGDASGNALFGSNINANSYISTNNTKVPIVGWSSNTVQSSDTDTRLVSAKYYGTQTTAMTTSTFYALDFPTKSFDSHAAWTTTGSHNSTLASGSKYVVPVSGVYRVSVACILNETSNSFNGTTELWDVILYKNGSNDSIIQSMRPYANQQYPTRNGTTLVNCVVGDILQIISSQSSGVNMAMLADNSLNYVTFERLSGPAVVQVASVISFSGTKGSTQALTANTTDITFTSSKDSNGVWTGSTYPVPSSGDYNVSALLADNGATSGTVSAYVNGVSTRSILFINAGNTGSGSAILPNLKSGDIISLRSNQNTTLAALGNISIFRLGGVM